MHARFGATIDEWLHFDLVLGLTEDLLPVVSNPDAVFANPEIGKSRGKVPSQYNAQHKATGISKWTSKRATIADLDAWAKEPDYGICLQTRAVRALDVDITDPILAARVAGLIAGRGFVLPRRERADSSKFLLAFAMPGGYRKRDIKVGGGQKIEFLATGQQFIAVGRHPRGARYEWRGGLPSSIPTLDEAAFEALWSAIAAEFGTGPAERSRDARDADSDLDYLVKMADASDAAVDDWESALMHLGAPVADNYSAWIDVVHAAKGLSDAGYPRALDVLHAFSALSPKYEADDTQYRFDTCAPHSKTYKDQLRAAQRAGWENPGSKAAEKSAPAAGINGLRPCQFVRPREIMDRPPQGYFVKKFLPRVGLATLLGAPSAGKSFIAIDLALAIARGVPWRGFRVRQARVAYIIAEGQGGFPKRLQAYSRHHDVDIDALPFIVHEGAPNMLGKDHETLATEIGLAGGADLIVIDTFAQVTAGGNENSSEDMGRALGNCRTLHHATGATILLVHHLGKDATKGARGWSGINAATDTELTVARGLGADRMVTSSKLKDDPDGDVFGFRLRSIPVGEDEDGEMMESAIVEHMVEPPKQKSVRSKGKHQIAVLEAVEHLGGVDGWAHEDEVLDRAIAAVQGDCRRSVARRALNQLVDTGEVERDRSRVRVAA